MRSASAARRRGWCGHPTRPALTRGPPSPSRGGRNIDILLPRERGDREGPPAGHPAICRNLWHLWTSRRSPTLSTRSKSTPGRASSDGPFAQAAAWIVAIGLLLIGAHLFATPHDQASLSLRDLTVYQSAIDAFAGSGFFTALVINNGTPLYALIAVALIPAVTRDRWLAFHIAVALATAFKPYYAAFWIVPVLADGPWGRRWVESAIGLAAAAATYVAPAILAPKLMAEWLHALLRETVGVGLLGDNLLGAMTKSHDGKAAAYAGQLAFSAALMVAALLLGRLDRRQRIAGLIMIAVFLNPRAMRYDLSTAAVPLLALAAGAFAAAPAGLLVQTAWAAVLAGVMIAFSHSAPTDGFLYAGVAVGALLVAIVGASGTSSRPRGEVGARREKVVGRT